jgi:hypothetical protein
MRGFQSELSTPYGVPREYLTVAFLRKDDLKSHNRQLASAGSQIQYSLSDLTNQPP